MAGVVFPKDGPRQRQSTAEVRLYDALVAHLPDGWRAWHSLRLRVGSGWEGEGDFVIADPTRGLLVLEVKGGRVELSGGRWLQNGRELPSAPRQQALGFVRHLMDAIRARGGEVPPYGVACAFPDVEFSQGPAAGDLDGLTLGQRELSWLETVLPTVLARALPDRPVPRSDRWIPLVHALWGDTWVPHVRLADRVEDAQERAIALDREQLAILDIAGENSRALVEGGAGTGKTLVARELCTRWAARGKRCLYLCFTDALAHAVDRYFESHRSQGVDVRAAPIRHFARDLLGDAGHDLPTTSTPDFWNEVSLRAACDALPPDDRRPDLVVIDESQDLTDGDWVLIEALAKDRALWLFGDPAQAFWKERHPPAALIAPFARLKLTRQYRNPEIIARFAALYRDPPSGEPVASIPTDPAVLRVSLARDGDVLGRVRHELDELRRQGVRPADIAIISLAGQTKSKLVTLSSLGTHAIVRADAPEAATHIVADTFLRFKGLDRPFVIVTELVHGPHMQYDVRMHIALTRATVGAIVVCAEASLAEDARLARCGSSGGGR